nr:TIGR04282 family arsenosugar biosynthesis glycosyltransferase [Rubrobacter marinus]
MAKAPLPGNAKTRLRLPPEGAARLQAALVCDTVEKASALGPTSVAGTPADGLALLEPLLPEGVSLFAQRGADLGERMLDAASRLFGEGPEPVLILGTDAPTLPPAEILAASRALRTHDAAIVGSDDGGYVLLGLRALHAALFRDVRWSTETVYRETVEKALGAGLSLYEGRPHYDVDYPEDLDRLAGSFGAAPARPRTAGVIEELLRPPRA